MNILPFFGGNEGNQEGDQRERYFGRININKPRQSPLEESQSANKPDTGTSNKALMPSTEQMQRRTRSKRIPPAMSAFCFSNIFNSLSPLALQSLQEAYRRHEGKLPPRSEIRHLSQATAVSQNRIRRWFLEHTHETVESSKDCLPSPQPPPPKIETPPSLVQQSLDMFEKRLLGVEQKLSLLEGEIKQVKDQVYSLDLFYPRWYSS